MTAVAYMHGSELEKQDHTADRRFDDDDGELFRSLYPELRRFAAVVAPFDADPDDLVQQATTNVLARGGLATVDNPRAYLKTAIANIAKNQYRRAGRAPILERPDDQVDTYPSDVADLEWLGLRDRSAVYLIDVEGLSFAEAAEMLDCSAAALRARVVRARRKLRRTLRKEGSR